MTLIIKLIMIRAIIIILIVVAIIIIIKVLAIKVIIVLEVMIGLCRWQRVVTQSCPQNWHLSSRHHHLSEKPATLSIWAPSSILSVGLGSEGMWRGGSLQQKHWICLIGQV